MKVLQSLLVTLTGWEHMKVVFEDTVTKNTKQFVFKVQQLVDGTYTVTQQAFRVFPDGGTVLKSEKTWQCATLDELRYGEFASSRQGKQFLDSQFWASLRA